MQRSERSDGAVPRERNKRNKRTKHNKHHEHNARKNSADTSRSGSVACGRYRLSNLRSSLPWSCHSHWTYVAAHVYLPAAIRRCVDAGVRSIEHGHLTDIDTAKILADKGVWWSVQPFLDDEDATHFPVGSINYEKQRQVTVGTENAYRWAREFKIKTAWGTDILFDEKQTVRQGAQLVKLQRWYSSIDVLRHLIQRGDRLSGEALRKRIFEWDPVRYAYFILAPYRLDKL